MSEESSAPQPSRRSFLDVVLGLGIVGWLGTVIYPIVRFLKPLPAAGPGGPVQLDEDQVAKLETDHFVILRAGAQRVLVIQTPDDKVAALSARCTHEGCTVTYVPGEAVIWCACHNAKFDLDGRVVSGPPPRPLPRFSAQRDEQGIISVTMEEA